MKKVNGITVYEPEDPCALDEYSEQLEKDLTAKFNEIEGENEQESADILTLQNKVTSLEQETEEQQGQITELQNKVIVLEDQIPTGEASGNPIYINDSSNLEAKLRLNGGDKQETREGYNLLDTSKLSTGTSNGIEKQINKENGKIILNGTTTLLTNCWIDNLNKTLVPGTYKFITDFDLILNSENIGAYVIKDVDGNNILQTRQSAEFVLEKETILNQVLIQINKGVKLDKQEIGLMIISGTENKNYEQYGAMPSPEYPSKIETVGSNVNELEYPFVDTTKTTNGITFTDNGDGTIIANGTATENAYFNLSKPTIKAGKYILSGIPQGASISTYFVKFGTVNITNSYEFDWVEEFTPTESYIRINKGVTVNNLVFKIKLEEGNQATPYSPYGMGSVEIDVCNKNKFKCYESYTQNGITLTKYADGSFKIEGTATVSTSFDISDYLKIKGTNTYKYERLSGSYTGTVWFWNKTDNNSQITLTNGQAKTFTFNEYKEIRLSFTVTAGTTYLFTARVQIEEGNTATDIVEHEQQTKIMPIQQEMLEGDYIEDVEYHTWKKIVLNGTENITQNSNKNLFVYMLPNDLGKFVGSKTIPDILSSHYPAIKFDDGYSGEKDYGITFGLNSGDRICIRNKDYNTVEEFKTALATNNLIIYYKLATPLDLELTEAQKEAKKINTYNNVTNIVADNSLATLDVTYKKDQNTVNKNYEDRIAALEAAILS